MRISLYNNYVTNKPPVAQYLEKHYLKWLNVQGEVRPQKDFAEYLGIEYSRFNRYYNGKRSDMDYLTALQICKRVGDYELFKILDYPVPFSDFPPEMAERLRAAVDEIDAELERRQLTGDMPGAEQVTISIFEKYGFKYVDTTDAT